MNDTLYHYHNRKRMIALYGPMISSMTHSEALDLFAASCHMTGSNLMLGGILSHIVSYIVAHSFKVCTR